MGGQLTLAALVPAEHDAVRASGRPVSDEVVRYLNLLFVLARHAAGGTGEPATTGPAP